MMETPQGNESRIRWSDEEAMVLALRILQLQALYPGLSSIKAFRKAQALLPPERQRRVTAWAAVAPRLEPCMQVLRAAEGFDAYIAEFLAKVEKKRAKAREYAAARRARSMEAQADAVMLLPSAVEPVKSRSRQVKVVPEAPSAESWVQTSFFAGDNATTTQVLIAGFPSVLARAMQQALADVDSHIWTPSQVTPSFHALASQCTVAVIPEEADDEFESNLRQRYRLQVVRHSGNPQRLPERLMSLMP